MRFPWAMRHERGQTLVRSAPPQTPHRSRAAAAYRPQRSRMGHPWHRRVARSRSVANSDVNASGCAWQATLSGAVRAASASSRNRASASSLS